MLRNNKVDKRMAIGRLRIWVENSIIVFLFLYDQTRYLPRMFRKTWAETSEVRD